MIRQELTGPLTVNPTEGGNDGDRMIVVEPAPAMQVILGPIPKEVADHMADSLSKTDEELKEKLIREQREEEAMKRLHLPDSVARQN